MKNGKSLIDESLQYNNFIDMVHLTSSAAYNYGCYYHQYSLVTGSSTCSFQSWPCVCIQSFCNIAGLILHSLI